MERAVIVSCNAYFAQLGTYNVGAQHLFDMGGLLGISMAAPATAQQLRKSLPQSSYGQGQVVASPFQMARVAAAVANGGQMPQGRWIADESNDRTQAAQAVIGPDVAATLGRYMREVVTQGTGRSASGAAVQIAGKTGTAELADAPPNAPSLRGRLAGILAATFGIGQVLAFAQSLRRNSVGYNGPIFFFLHPVWKPPVPALLILVAFAVLIENGQYGGTYAAPTAAALVNAAQSLGLVGGAKPAAGK